MTTTKRFEFDQEQFEVLGVFDADPPYVYTYGLTPIAGFEFIVIAPARVNNLHNILMGFLHALSMSNGNIVGDYPEIAHLLNGEPLRGRVVDVTTYKGIGHYVTKRVDGVNQIYQLILADKNNILHGEPGYDRSWDQEIKTWQTVKFC